MKRVMNKEMEKMSKHIKHIYNNFSNNNNNNDNNNDTITVEQPNTTIKNNLEIKNLKVIVNGECVLPLFQGEFYEEKNLTYQDLKKIRPFAYFQQCYDTQQNIHISNDQSYSTDRVISKDYLYSNNSHYQTEHEWEMNYICRNNHNDTALIWSWEFDSKVEISETSFNFLFNSFEVGAFFKLYVARETDGNLLAGGNNERIKKHIREDFLMLPLKRTTGGLITFDKRMIISDYTKGSNKFYLACIFGNSGAQLFRTPTLNWRDIHPYNSNPNLYQHQFPFPFQINFQVLPINLSNNGNGGSDDDGCGIQHLTTENKSKLSIKQINQFGEFYFTDENVGSKYISKLKQSKVKLWDNDRVLQWLFDLSFFQLIDKFKELKIDGEKLLNLDIEQIHTSTLSPKQKKKFIKSLNTLLQISGKLKHETPNTLLINNNKMTSPDSLVLKKKKKQSDNNNKTTTATTTATTTTSTSSQLTVDELPLLLLNDEKSNYKLIIQDKILNVHKEVLSKNSEYFDAMFSSGFSESLHGTSNFDVDEHLNYESLKSIMEFVYITSKDLKIEFLKLQSLQQLSCLITLCDRFLFNKLKKLVENYVIYSISPTNINEINQLFNYNQNIFTYTNFFLKYSNK